MNWIVWLILAWIALSFTLAAVLGWFNGKRRQATDGAYIHAEADCSSNYPPALHRADLLVHGRSITR